MGLHMNFQVSTICSHTYTKQNQPMYAQTCNTHKKMEVEKEIAIV